MPNNRVFYACQYVEIQPTGGSARAASGVQSLGMTTNFSLQQVFQFGMLNIYENLENIPEVQITLEKALDGTPPLFLMGTSANSPNPSLIARADNRFTTRVGIFPDTGVRVAGNPMRELEMTGMYYSSLSYSFTVDGIFTESITAVGNHKLWKNSGFTVSAAGFGDNAVTAGPPSGVNRRQNLYWGSAASTSTIHPQSYSVIPTDIPGVHSTSGVNYEMLAHIQRITASVDLGREDMFELGRRLPYHRYVNYPVLVTTEVEYMADSGDLVSMTETGVYSDGVTPCNRNYNVKDQKIRIVTCEGTHIYLGDNNKLTSVNYGGGDTGGGNVTITHTYNGYNEFNVLHMADLVAGLRPTGTLGSGYLDN